MLDPAYVILKLIITEDLLLKFLRALAFCLGT